MLEYYNGMLFLTTNRLEDFDDAFYNRVHVTVKYDALSKLERTNIWRQHLTRACKRNRQTEPTWDNEIYETLSSIDTNGRDIRNYTRTAYGLATALKEDLAVSHVISVIHNNLSRERAEALGEIFAKLEHLGKQAGKRAVVGGAETAALAPEIAVAATS